MVGWLSIPQAALACSYTSNNRKTWWEGGWLHPTRKKVIGPDRLYKIYVVVYNHPKSLITNNVLTRQENRTRNNFLAMCFTQLFLMPGGGGGGGKGVPILKIYLYITQAIIRLYFYYTCTPSYYPYTHAYMLLSLKLMDPTHLPTTIHHIPVQA